MLKLIEHQVIGIVGDRKDNARLFRIFRLFSDIFFQIQWSECNIIIHVSSRLIDDVTAGSEVRAARIM